MIFCANGYAAEKLTREQRGAARRITHEKLEQCLPAIEELGRIKTDQSVQLLAQAFRTEKRPLVRRYLVDTLGRLQRPGAAPVLAEALQDPDVQVRQSAVVALSMLGGAVSDQALIAQADREGAWEVEAYLAQALGRSRHPGAEARLKRFAQSSRAELRQAAQEAIEKRAREKKK